MRANRRTKVTCFTVAIAALVASAWILEHDRSRRVQESTSSGDDRRDPRNGGDDESATKKTTSTSDRATTDSARTTDGDVETSRAEDVDRHRLRVRCHGTGGRPLSNVLVRFVTAASVEAAKLDETDAFAFVERVCKTSVVTDADGAASLELASGRWFAVVHAARCHVVGKWIDVPDTSSLEFELIDAVAVEGLVVDGVTKAPIGAASVVAFVMATTDDRADPSSRFARMAVGQRVVTDDEGKFRLDETAPTRLELDVTASGYPTARVFTSPGDPRVVVELNGRGAADGVVVDLNGAPIVGAKVEAWLRGRLPPTLLATTNTDDQGEFHFREILDGDVDVDAKKRGYAFAKKNLTLDAQKPPWLEFELGPEAPLKGRVVDEMHRPVVGAKVHVSDRELNHEIGQMDTEADGSWYMLWVVPGHRVDVSIEHPGFFGQEFKNVPLRDEVQTFTLRRLLGLHGRVVDPDGKPVTRFALWTDVRLREHDEEQTRALRSPWTEVANDRGEFDFDTLSPCDYELRFSADGLLDEIVSYPLSWSRAPQPKPLEVHMRRGSVFSGRVVDETSRPLSGVSVGIAGATSGGRDVAPLASACASTAGDGSFTLRNAPRTPFDLVLASSDRGQTIVSELRAEDFPRDLVLPPSGSIVGRVSSPWRDPTSCLEVRLQRSGSWIGRTLPVDGAGRFESGPLAAGEYEVDVADAWSRSELDGDFDFSRVVTVRAGATTDVEIDADPRPSLRGVVRDRAGDLDPLSVTIRVARADRPTEVVSVARLQSDFRYMIPGLAAGRHVVTLDLSRPGRLGHVEREVDVVASHATELDFEVESVSFRGRVVDAANQPLAAQIRLLDASNGAIVGAVRCDRDGRFQVVPPASTRCLVWIMADGCAEDWATTIDLSSTNDGAEVTKTLDVESRLEVAVVDDVDRPIPDAVVEVESIDRSPILPRLAAATDASGVARFPGLRAGRATVVASDPHHVAAVPSAVALERDATRRVVVVLERLAALVVLVHDERGTAISGVDVVCTLARPNSDPGTVTRTARTDSRGVCHFDGLPAGRAAVTIGSITSDPLSIEPSETRQLDLTIPRSR